MNTENKKCPICGLRAHIILNNSALISNGAVSLDGEEPIRVECPACGDFYISINMIDCKFTDEEKIKLCFRYATAPYNDSYTRFENYIKNEATKNNIIRSIISPENLIEKINYTLLHFAKRSKFFNHTIEIKEDGKEYRLLFCNGYSELYAILNSLKELNYIESDTIGSQYIFTDGENDLRIDKLALTLKGLEKANKLEMRINSEQCFVAMWFSDETEKLYDKIESAIQGNSKAGKESSDYGAGYRAFKINDKLHANYIPPEIIAEIKRSKFMVADLTGYRGGVYYEAGFAEGLGIPVIYTCRKDWLEDKKDNINSKEKVTQNGVHFDLKQKNIILWDNENLDEFQRTLTSTIGAIVTFNT